MCRLAAWLCVGMLVAGVVEATPHVPLTWRAPVDLDPRLRASRQFAGQEKRTSWARDENQDFIDDAIAQRFGPGQHVNVAVALNRVLSGNDVVALLGPYGTVRYVGRNLAFALVDGVKFEDLARVAALQEVAMVEWQVPVYGMTDVATRTIHARDGCTLPSSADCGDGINVAVVDYGVTDGAGTVFAGRFVGGYDPYSTGSPTNGTFNPAADALTPHGTAVASILLGASVAGLNCRPLVDPAPFAPRDCRGVAPGAGLVDVKACRIEGVSAADLLADGECPLLFEALEWLADHAADLEVRVANISLGSCVDDPDPGDGVLDKTIDLLVERGVTVVVAGGNSGGPCPKLVAGMRSVAAPASSSLAITVGQRNDVASIDPANDSPGSTYLTGPRLDYVGTSNPLALKPDLVAPSQGLLVSVPTGSVLGGYPREVSGSSIASPQVAGAAALILADREMRPAAIKELLRTTASRVISFENDIMGQCPVAETDPHWDCTYGAGLLDVGAALGWSTAGDVKFPACLDDPVDPGEPCDIADGVPSYANDLDIWTDPETLVAGVLATIHVRVQNAGSVPASPIVAVSVTTFGAGFPDVDVVAASRLATPLAPGATSVVDLAWTPKVVGHQCLHAMLAEASDGVPGNDMTQRNVVVLDPAVESFVRMDVANPLDHWSKFKMKGNVNRSNWTCTVTPDLVDLDPADPSAAIHVQLTAPPMAPPTMGAFCDVEVRSITGSASMIGGVVVRSKPLGPCLQRVRVLNSIAQPLPGILVTAWRRGITVVGTTDASGTANLLLTDAALYELTVHLPGESMRRIVAARCGDTVTFRPQWIPASAWWN